MTDIPDIKYVELDMELINKFSSESEFIGVSVDLLIEAGSYVCMVGSALPFKEKAWDSNQAVLGGHLVRLYKLISAILDQTCQHRREISFMFARMAFECIINLAFIIKNYSPELLVSYKSYSLKHEKKLMTKINENIALRDGEVLPIETRMINSIFNTFKASGLMPEDINPKELRNWGGMNIYEKAENVGMGEAYLAAFGGPSHNIHGNWQDLLEYQLEETDEGMFTPDFEWHNPRPQYLNVVALHSAGILKQYIDWLGYDEINHITENLNEFQNRVLDLDSAHEQWLSQNA